MKAKAIEQIIASDGMTREEAIADLADLLQICAAEVWDGIE